MTQGTNLSPFLFSIFLNEYADGTVIFTENEETDTQQALDRFTITVQL